MPTFIFLPLLLKAGIIRTNDEHQEGILFTSLQGNPEDRIGDLLVVKNRWTIGVSEEAILLRLVLLADFRRFVNLQTQAVAGGMDEFLIQVVTLQHGAASRVHLVDDDSRTDGIEPRLIGLREPRGTARECAWAACRYKPLGSCAGVAVQGCAHVY